VARRSTKAILALLIASAVTFGVIVGVRALFHVAQSTLASPYCDFGTYELDTSQASVAAQMVGEVSRFSPALPERAAVLVLAGALQESKLSNLGPGDGDRDSVGVLQQRPSEGWGKPPGNAASLTNVTEATREFLVRLIRIDNWQDLELAVAVQDVQVSADGSLYAQYEGEAQTLSDALQGHVPAGITCTIAKPTLVAAATTVAAQLSAQLPVKKPSVEGLTITVPGAAWETAAWFVANADRLGIAQVSYDKQTWTRTHQWRASTAPKTEVTATMAKLKS
jgi:hypothetical protein